MHGLRRRKAMRIALPGVVFLPLIASAQATRARGAATVGAVVEPAPSGRADGPAAPTVDGPAGLLRMRTTDVGPPKSFRLALHTEMFTKSDLLVAGDEDNRFIGTLALAGTPVPW